MQRIAFVLALLCFAICNTAVAATKSHVMSFGKWTVVKCSDADGQHMIDIKVRPLFIDSRLKEYTTGNPHDVTDRLFVVRRVFRVNDALPEETGVHWQWQQGGWVLVDRLTGRISQLNLPEFDPWYSVASWYRDYVAYCGLSEDAKKLYAMVAQVGYRKPVLRQLLGERAGSDAPDSECATPGWQRTPARVTFQSKRGTVLSFSIRGRMVDTVREAEGEGDD